MKKFFAAALASAMVVTMAATSFAAATITFDKASSYDSDTFAFTPLDNNSGKIAYGKTVYYAIESAGAPVTKYDAVKGISIKQKWEMNGAAVEKVAVVKMKNADATDAYAYYVGVTNKANSTTSNTDVVGELTLRKSGSDVYAFTDTKLSVTYTLGYNQITPADKITDGLRIMNFKGFTGEQTIYFSKADDNYFEVVTDGQGKLLVKADVKYNADIAAKYPMANLDFFNGNGASFNKTGVLTIAADPGSFLYQVNADGNLVAVKATYDEYEEAFKVKTRALNAYVISDVELKLVNTVTPDTDNTAKPNPGTGANA